MKGRLRERVHAILATLLPTLKDPRIGFVTITDVRLTRDNEHATIWYTVLPDTPEQRAQTAAGLASAAPLLRRELASALSVRKVPTVDFRPDPAPEQGRRIEELLSEVAATEESGDA